MDPEIKEQFQHLFTLSESIKEGNPEGIEVDLGDFGQLTVWLPIKDSSPKDEVSEGLQHTLGVLMLHVLWIFIASMSVASRVDEKPPVYPPLLEHILSAMGAKVADDAISHLTDIINPKDDGIDFTPSPN